jgi:hypothetical protein
MDGVTTINGLSTNNQDLELATGTTHQLTVSQPINAGTAGLTLETDNLALNDTVTGNTVVLHAAHSQAGRSRWALPLATLAASAVAWRSPGSTAWSRPTSASASVTRRCRRGR